MKLPSSDAEQLFSAHIDEDRGDFEALCRAYPRHAEEFRILMRAHEGRGGLTSRVTFPDRREAAPPPSIMGIEPGRVIGDFELVRPIGQGGMGQVWEAEQVSLSRRVALKLILPGRINERATERFVREARAGGRLNHPGIVAVHGFGEAQGVHWIAQELVTGGVTLCDFIDERARAAVLPEDHYRTVALLAAELAESLHVAHEAGVVHRDLKPQNVLLTEEGRTKLTDFGLARVLDETALSETGEIAGTWFYMSPEQIIARRDGIDRRTDVFSLGIVLYELLALRRPFEGDTAGQVIEKILEWDPPELQRIRSRIPNDLAVICHKALEKRRAKRYQTTRELAEDLRRFLANEPIHARPPTTLERAWKWSLRHPTKSVAAVLVALAFVSISGLGLRISKQRDDLRVQQTALTKSNAALEDERANLAALNTDLEKKTEEARANFERAEEQRERAEREEEAARVEAENAKLEAKKALAVQTLLLDILMAADPSKTSRADLTVRSVLDRTTEQIDDYLADYPDVRPTVLLALAKSYFGLELTDDARRMARQAIEEKRRVEPEADLELADMLYILGEIVVRKNTTGTHVTEEERQESESSLEEALAIVAELEGEESDLYKGILGSLVEVRSLEEPSRHELPDEYVWYIAMLEGRDIEEVRAELGRMLAQVDEAWRAGRKDEARKIIRDSAADFLANPTLQRQVPIAWSRFATWAMDAGEPTIAEPMYRECIALSIELDGEEHFHTAVYTGNLGVFLKRAGRYQEAAEVLSPVYEARETVFGPTHGYSFIIAERLAESYEGLGRNEEAETIYRQCFETARRELSDDSDEAYECLKDLIGFYRKSGPVPAQEALDEVLATTAEDSPARERWAKIPVSAEK